MEYSVGLEALIIADNCLKLCPIKILYKSVEIVWPSDSNYALYCFCLLIVKIHQV